MKVKDVIKYVEEHPEFWDYTLVFWDSYRDELREVTKISTGLEISNSATFDCDD